MRTTKIPLYGFLNSRIQRLKNLAKIAMSSRLNISNLDDVGNNVIAMDPVQKKLLYLEHEPGNSSCLIVDLNNLQDCSIKKQYNGIKAGGLTNKKMEAYLKNIFLNLRFKHDAAPVTLSLYESLKDKQDDIEQLEVKAKKWQQLVSTLLPVKIPERA